MVCLNCCDVLYVVCVCVCVWGGGGSGACLCDLLSGLTTTVTMIKLAATDLSH